MQYKREMNGKGGSGGANLLEKEADLGSLEQQRTGWNRTHDFSLDSIETQNAVFLI